MYTTPTQELERALDAIAQNYSVYGPEPGEILYFTETELIGNPGPSLRYLVEVIKAGEVRLLDCCVRQDGQPNKPKLTALIERLGDGWELLSFWLPIDDCDTF